MTHPLVAIGGPTGSGKSALALFLAEQLGAEIVNYDSVQVHRGLEIGSAKTPLADRRGIPHHLLDVVAADEELTAGSFIAMARQALDEIRLRGKLPILSGGTGFYLRALIHGLSPAPPRNAALRDRLTELAARRPAALHRFLRRLDTAAARRIHSNDLQKVIRAIELAEHPVAPRQPLAGYRVLKLALEPERGALYERLNRRSAWMFGNGLLEETQRLLNGGIASSAKALQSLGYRQAVQLLTGELDLAAAIAECQLRTRQYAKRQGTWFRAEPGVERLTGFGDEAAVQQQAYSRICAFLG